ncbi:hypothetical protein ACHAWF_003778 [Thalassiosira exigua]
MRLSVPRRPACALPKTMESLFATTMPIMDNSRTMPSFSTATSPISCLPSVVSMLTSRNCFAEKVIHDLMEATRKQLLFVKVRWPEAIDMSLWPYALYQAACNDYLVPQYNEGLSKLDIFGNLLINANLKSIHTFRCPVYVLVGNVSSAGTVELDLGLTSASLLSMHATSLLALHCAFYKCDLTTNEVKKYKAPLNVHDSKQTYGVNYFETYAPVVTWFAIRLMINFGITFGWTLKQIDFINQDLPSSAH